MSLQFITSLQKLGQIEDAKQKNLVLCGSLVYYTLNPSAGALPNFIPHEARDITLNKLIQTKKEKLHVFIDKKIQEYSDFHKIKIALDIDYYLEAGKSKKGALVLIGGHIEPSNAIIHLYFFRDGRLEKIEEKMNLHPGNNWFKQDLQKIIDDIIAWDKDTVIHIAEEMPHRELLIDLTNEISTIRIFMNKKVKPKYIKPKTEGLVKQYGLGIACGFSALLYFGVTAYQQHSLTKLQESYTRKEVTLPAGALNGLENLDIIKAKQNFLTTDLFKFDEFSNILRVLVNKEYLIKDFTYSTSYIKENHMGTIAPNPTATVNEGPKEIKVVSVSIFVPISDTSEPYKSVSNILKEITTETGLEFRLKQNGWKKSKEVFEGDLKEGLLIDAEGIK